MASKAVSLGLQGAQHKLAPPRGTVERGPGNTIIAHAVREQAERLPSPGAGMVTLVRRTMNEVAVLLKARAAA